jgi:hypothetical protein
MFRDRVRLRRVPTATRLQMLIGGRDPEATVH